MTTFLIRVGVLHFKVLEHLVLAFRPFVDLAWQQTDQGLHILLGDVPPLGHHHVEFNHQVSMGHRVLVERHAQSPHHLLHIAHLPFIPPISSI